MKKFLIKVGTSVKEFFRKLMVTLKRRPHLVALVMTMVSFIVYSFNLTNMSNTTSLVSGPNMGLCQFAIMLFSALSIVCLLGSFPRRERPKVFLLVLYFAMCAVIIFCDVAYYLGIEAKIGGPSPSLVPKEDGSQDFVFKAQSLMVTHAIMVSVSTLLTATVKLYGKLFRLVNTNVELEYTEATEKIEIDEE